MNFLDALFGYKDDDHHILIWTRPDKKTRTFIDINAANEYVETVKDDHDVYFGLGLGAEPLPSNRRYTHDQIVGLPGFWCDLDFGANVHDKKKRPPTPSDARGLLDAIPQRPTMMVLTGHGFHVYWLFNEIWLLETEEERNLAADLLRRIQAPIQAAAKTKGWAIDSTHDLPRVLRIPGTFNHKDRPPLPVEVVEYEIKRRYNPPLDFEELPLFASSAERKPAQNALESFRGVEFTSTLTETRLKYFLGIEPRIMLSWERARRDLADQSPSSYHMSLASFAAQAGWKDEDIKSLLVEFNRKHSIPLEKLLSTKPRVQGQTYLAHTIERAREAAKGGNFGPLEEAVAALGTEDATPESVATAKQAVSDAIGLPVLRVICLNQDPPTYQLVVEQGGQPRTIKVGGISNLIEPNKLKRAILEGTNPAHLMPYFKPKDWRLTERALVGLIEREDVCEEATDEGQTRVWLEEYCRVQTILDDSLDNLEAALLEKAPWRDAHGLVHISADSLLTYLARGKHENLSSRELQARLRLVGCHQEKQNIEVQNRRTTLRSWVLPKAITES